jgi:pimeloyl-ACP methyl ester carboxylesterase
MPEVALRSGTVHYRQTGTGPTIVLIHGLFADSTHWDRVVSSLGRDRRVIVPDMPLGAHRLPMDADADLTPAGLARLIADFLAELGLDGVTLVGNDTGGALCQLVAADHPELIGRLVLTNCDAYRNFLPWAFRGLQLFPRLPGGMTILAKLPTPIGRALFRPLTARPMPAEQLDRWLRAPRGNPGVKRDLGKVLRGITNRETLRAIEALRRSAPPTLLVWGRRDLFFRPRYARRLAADIPGARLQWIDRARTFTPFDAPQELAAAIRGFDGAGSAARP